MSEKGINPRYAERKRKPSGWKGARGCTWWTKNTKFGVKYKCPHCQKTSLGIGGPYMHFTGCPNKK